MSSLSVTEEEQPIYLNTEALLANKSGAEASGLAMDLLLIIYWPLKQAFIYDPENLAARMNVVAPGRGYSASKLKKLKKKASTFFTVLEDGRWAPSPIYFSLTDGNVDQSDQPSN